MFSLNKFYHHNFQTNIIHRFSHLCNEGNVLKGLHFLLIHPLSLSIHNNPVPLLLLSKICHTLVHFHPAPSLSLTLQGAVSEQVCNDFSLLMTGRRKAKGTLFVGMLMCGCVFV